MSNQSLINCEFICANTNTTLHCLDYNGGALGLSIRMRKAVAGRKVNDFYQMGHFSGFLVDFFYQTGLKTGCLVDK